MRGETLAMKTFQEKREEVLARYDQAVAALRVILADPKANSSYPLFYLKVRLELDQIIKDCHTLNTAENL